MTTRPSRGTCVVVSFLGAFALVGAGSVLSCGLALVGAESSHDASAADDNSAACREATDCAKPECTCIEPPKDWNVVVVVDDVPSSSGVDGGLPTGTACPQGWTNGRWLRANPRASATSCSCSCGTPSSNPCTTGAVAVLLDGNSNPGDDLCNDGNATLGTDGGCQTVNFGWSTTPNEEWAGISGTPPTAVKVACKDSTLPPPIIDDGALRVCDAPPGPRVPKPPSLRACVWHDGDEPACPSGFGERHVVVDGVVDERTCAACDCNTSSTPTCAAPTVTFYSDTNCTQNVRTAVIKLAGSGDCERIQGNVAVIPTHYKYAATPATAADCAPKSPTSTVSGTLVPTSTITVCCSPH